MSGAMDSSPDLPAPPALAELVAEGPLALFLDFDGTLVEIASTPDEIIVPGDLNRRIEALSARLHGRLALVSGRAVDNLEQHCGSLAVARAGSHGLACFTADGEQLGDKPSRLPADLLDALGTFAASEGFTLEAKPHGAALHYRSDPALEERGKLFATSFADDNGLSVKCGKCVIELVQPGADKASAVRAFMAEPPFRGSRPVFVGDDLTDEDGFAAARALGGFGVLVGGRSPTAAKYGLADPAAVQQWLDL